VVIGRIHCPGLDVLGRFTMSNGKTMIAPLPTDDTIQARWTSTPRDHTAEHDSSDDPTDERVFTVTMVALALAFIGISVYGLYKTNIVLILNQYINRILVYVLLLAGARFYRWRRAGRAVNLIRVTFWTLLFGTLYQFPMFIASRAPVGMKDSVLAGFDRALGIEVPQVLRFMDGLPALNRLLVICYNLLLLLMVVAIIVPPLCGRMRDAKEYVLAGVVSAIISLPLFSTFQAVGPWVHYGYDPLIRQDNYMETFRKLKAEGTFVMDIDYSDGLICFPSFHTILAVLAAVALRRVPIAGWAAGILASLIVISTVTTGSHYIIDVIAGFGVALLSIIIARIYSRAEAHWYRRTASGGLGAFVRFSNGIPITS
jgi:hypothetical protein